MNRIKISITQKHFVYFLFLYIFSIFCVGYYSYYISKKSILDRTFNQLTSVRVEKAKNIERFFQDRLREIVLISKTDAAINIFHQAFDGFGKQILSLEYIKSFIAPNKYYNRIILIDSSNQYLISDSLYSFANDKFFNDTDFIISNHLDKLIKDIKEKKEICIQDYHILQNGNLAFYIGTPVLDNYNNLIGIILFEMQTSSINNIIYNSNQNNGLGKTGESYIVGSDYLLRTSSRFKENSIKNINVETKASKLAFQNQFGTIIIKDYRNVDVLSSFSPLYIEGLKWSIIAEIDKEEALQPIYNLRNSIIILCLIVSIFIFGLVYLGSTKLTTPIISLKNAAIKISEGDYNSKVNSTSNDEIGELITAFNNMSLQLLFQSEQIKKDKLLRISSVIDAQEQERQRLSRDLHDGLGQMLLAVKIKLEQVKNSDYEKSQNYLKEAFELLKNSISEIRAISNDLIPTVLSNFGLEDGIKRLCRDSLLHSGIKFELSCDGIFQEKINQKIQIYIYRIIQEIINNIIKHSKAKEAKINIYFNTDNIIIFALDNGIGFDVKNRKNGNGIYNIFERSELLNGKCLLESEINIGTTFNITIPLNYE